MIEASITHYSTVIIFMYFLEYTTSERKGTFQGQRTVSICSLGYPARTGRDVQCLCWKTPNGLMKFIHKPKVIQMMINNRKKLPLILCQFDYKISVLSTPSC